MTKEEAKDILVRHDDLVWQRDNNITMGKITEALDIAIDALKNPWHKIADEGLPKEDGVYLVRDCRHGNPFHNNLRVTNFSVKANENVTPQYCCYTHWMPIPKLPMED